MMDLTEKIEGIVTKSDFIYFMECLLQDLRNNSIDWENKNLESYLSAITSWTEDMEGYFQNNKLETPQDINWKLFAMVLTAARIYE